MEVLVGFRRQGVREQGACDEGGAGPQACCQDASSQRDPTGHACHRAGRAVSASGIRTSPACRRSPGLCAASLSLQATAQVLAQPSAPFRRSLQPKARAHLLWCC